MFSFSNEIEQRRTLSLAATALGLLALGVVACQPESEDENEDAPPVVEVTAVDHAFAVPDTIPSGWVTFRMTNKGEETHYFQFNRLPEGRTYAEFHRRVVQPQDSLRQLLLAGDIDSTELKKAFGRIAPELVKKVYQENIGGGMALVAPGHTVQTTIKMAPGTYVMSCALQSPNRRLHANQGMSRPITVAEEMSGTSPPEPDVTMRATGHEVTAEGSMGAGTQTVAYHVDESSAEMENYYGSAYLARIDPDTEVDELGHENILLNPQPATFLGGVEYAAPGRTAYAELDLTAGRYAWLVLSPEKDTVWTFTVK